MKLWILLALCALATAAPTWEQDLFNVQPSDFTNASERSFLVNALIRQFFAYVRRVIRNGSNILGLPPLDPLEIDVFHLVVPAVLINLDLDLKGVLATGLGDFVVHRSHLNLAELTFDLDISIPEFHFGADSYDLIGDLYSAIPLYGKGPANFELHGFRFKALVYLKQSEDEKSVIIDKIEKASFEIPSFKSNMAGVIGGGDIDPVANAITEEVLIGYVNRFQSAISHVTAETIIAVGNPILDQLDTWRFLAPLLPRQH
ncbi:hypothetical protein ACJJTC_001300 [Scirpophaga incertulas]